MMKGAFEISAYLTPMSSYFVAPSLLSADILNLKDEIDKVTQAGANWLHIDIMDGHYVPNISYGSAFVRQIKKISQIPLDVHLMISPVDTFLEEFVHAGADRITIHADACYHPHRTLQTIHQLGIKAGIAINPGQNIEFIEPFLDLIDLVLVMGVNPGFGGQKYLENVTLKIQKLRTFLDERTYRHIIIQVDGGINDVRAKAAAKAGAQAFVAGYFIFETPTKTVEYYTQQIQKLKNQH